MHRCINFYNIFETGMRVFPYEFSCTGIEISFWIKFNRPKLIWVGLKSNSIRFVKYGVWTGPWLKFMPLILTNSTNWKKSSTNSHFLLSISAIYQVLPFWTWQFYCTFYHREKATGSNAHRRATENLGMRVFTIYMLIKHSSSFLLLTVLSCGVDYNALS